MSWAKNGHVVNGEQYLRPLDYKESDIDIECRLFFERVNFVDYVFSTLAKSIIDGPLSKLPNAKCHTIKVATADSLSGESSSRGREPTHLICLYFDVIWNAQHAKEVLETVVKEHGQLPNSAKADLYTVCGLDSNVSEWCQYTESLNC